MGANAAHPDAASRNGDVEGTDRVWPGPMQSSRGIVSEQRIGPADEHSSVRAGKEARLGRSPQMDAPVHRVQQPALDAVSDRAAADAECTKLRGRHHPVLARRDAPDQQIHMHDCRIEVLPADLCQNCAAYVQLCRRS